MQTLICGRKVEVDYERILANEAIKHIDEEIILEGWLHNGFVSFQITSHSSYSAIELAQSRESSRIQI
ncbi:MAG: hypothetical protein R2883_07375 [Caldisericia bacterium]